MHPEIIQTDAEHKTTGVKHLKSLLMKTGLRTDYFLSMSKISLFKEICHKDRVNQGRKEQGPRFQAMKHTGRGS